MSLLIPATDPYLAEALRYLTLDRSERVRMARQMIGQDLDHAPAWLDDTIWWIALHHKFVEARSGAAEGDVFAMDVDRRVGHLAMTLAGEAWLRTQPQVVAS